MFCKDNDELCTAKQMYGKNIETLSKLLQFLLKLRMLAKYENTLKCYTKLNFVLHHCCMTALAL